MQVNYCCYRLIQNLNCKSRTKKDKRTFTLKQNYCPLNKGSLILENLFKVN